MFKLLRRVRVHFRATQKRQRQTHSPFPMLKPPPPSSLLYFICNFIFPWSFICTRVIQEIKLTSSRLCMCLCLPKRSREHLNELYVSHRINMCRRISSEPNRIHFLFLLVSRPSTRRTLIKVSPSIFWIHIIFIILVCRFLAADRRFAWEQEGRGGI